MILSVEGLTREFVRGGKLFRAVDNVCFSVDSGDFITIIGRSGSGKSTLLNLVSGMLTPSSGSVKIDNIELSSLTDGERAVLRNSRMGYIAQGQSALPALTVLDNVRLPHFLGHKAGDPTEHALELLDAVGIASLAEEYPSHLSGGELRRVAIARSLLNSPSIIIADEPTSDLDQETTVDIIRLFQKISEAGTAVLMVTHNLDNVIYGTHQYKMDSGRLSLAL